MNKINDYFRDFFLTNKFSRTIRNFINQILTPVIIKILILLIFFLIIFFISFKIYKPDLIAKLNYKIGNYLIKYLNLDNNNFKKIKITGNKRVSNDEIINIIHLSNQKIFINNEEYQPIIQNLIDEIKSQLLWVNKITILRNMPDTLYIKIEEYQPFAIWYNNNKKFIIDKDGNSVPFDDKSSKNDEFKEMIILSGRGANIHAKALFDIFAINPALSKKIYSAAWVGGRRWNIRFDNDLLVKMPEDEIYNAWQQLIKIYNQGKINDFQVIDLRINGKIYIEYNDSDSKELKSL